MLILPKIPPKKTDDWYDFFSNNLTDRCDLDILLKNRWRHKVIIRNSENAQFLMDKFEFLVKEEEYQQMKSFLGKNKRISFLSLCIAAFYNTLMAYGHGSQISIALLSHIKDKDDDSVMLFPLLFDKNKKHDVKRIAVLKKIESVLTKKKYIIDQEKMMKNGLFDASFTLVSENSELLKESDFPISVYISDNMNDGYLRWTICYAKDLFGEKTISAMADVAHEILLQFSMEPSKLIKDLHLMPSDQKRKLAEWNETDGEFPENTRLNELIEDVIARNGDFEALVYKNTSLTYKCLNQHANKISTWLLSSCGKMITNEIVALYLDKTEIVICTMLGLWKAGVAFVAIDLNYPDDRVNFIINDCRAKRIITNSNNFKKLKKIISFENSNVEIIQFEEIMQGKIELQPNLENPMEAKKLDSTGLAYVSYTSGTTGVPKGVPKDHRSVVNSITDISDKYDMLDPKTERVALFSSYAFEPFIRQALIALINTQTLVIVPDDVRMDSILFPKFLKKNNITYLNGTGSILHNFDFSSATKLKRILLVGEELTNKGLQLLRRTFSGKIINEYAFTEAAFVTATKEFAEGVVVRTNRSIGRPLRNIKCYVLNPEMKHLPIGAIGELYIGGAGVANGYLRRSKLTKEKFLNNPFQTESEKKLGKNSRLYKTGDLTRVLPNGEYEYMGRIDFQMKLNGIRVEPGEIEARAMEFPDITKCIVVPCSRGDLDHYLVGYYTAKEKSIIDEDAFFAFLEKNLIRVMVPARMIQLESIPLNINGKVDIRALQQMSAVTSETLRAKNNAIALVNIDNKPSQNSILTILKNIWSELFLIPADIIHERDDFFRLGGQSICCILLIAHIRRKIKVKLTVNDIYSLRTLKNITQYIVKKGETISDDDIVGQPLEKITSRSSFSLLANGLHQGLLYQALKTKSMNGTYIMQSIYQYNCDIRANLLKKSWALVLSKYPGLRLRFEWKEDPMQVIDKIIKNIKWYYEDISADKIEVQEEKIVELQSKDRSKAYDLSESPLFRVYLIKQHDTKYTLIFSCHHIIIDGWSLSILHNIVHRTYLSLIDNLEPQLDEDTAYIAAQIYWKNHLNDSTDYWLDRLESIGERCDLSGLLNEQAKYKVNLRNYDKIIEHKQKRLILDKEQTKKIKSLCANNSITIHSALQFVWHKVLHAIGGGQSTLVGTIISSRNLPIKDIEQSIGLFINTLPLIVNHDIQRGKSILSAINDIQFSVNQMNNHSIVELGRLKIGSTKRGLFDTLLVFENYPRLMDKKEEEYHREKLQYQKISNFDRVDYPLAIVACEENDQLVLDILYAGELFEEDAIDILFNTAETIFNQLISDITLLVCEIDLCSKETLSLFEQWNNTETPFNEDITLHEVFELAASKYCHSLAVVYEDVKLTYLELNSIANQLANHFLRTVKLQPNDLVALILDKNEKMISTILAVWKAGAAYVPIDPNLPDERILFILADTQSRLILTNTSHAERIKKLNVTCKPVIDIETISLVNDSKDKPITSVTSTDLAYAIYTSGTTGTPKAVLVEHKGVVNLQVALAQIFSLKKENGSEAILSFSNYVFDHFIEQMIDALLNGQKLVILNDEMRTDEERLLEYMAENHITYLSGTPSVLSLYDFSKANSLIRIDAIGEDFTEPVFNKIRSTFKGTIINGYGPTEVSITTHKRIYKKDEFRTNKSIGYPVANIQCYVLNSDMKHVPIGGIGELYLGGIGVTRGYLNREDLTSESFLNNPFQARIESRNNFNSRIYKTGDLARWLPNGELECLGRADSQVKINGNRVELGEIEFILTSYLGITRSIIVEREHKSKLSSDIVQKYLVGFYLSDEDIKEELIKEWMRSKLPTAIVPLRIVKIKSIPITASGKLDVKKLPDTSFHGALIDNYVAPKSKIEIKLCGVWSDILGIPMNNISVNDDFFGLGGDSIRAISLAQVIKKSFGINFSVSSVFKKMTISSQKKHIKQSLGKKSIEPLREIAPVKSIQMKNVPASFAQQRLIFIHDFEGASTAYNIPFCLKIGDCNDKCQKILTETLQKLLLRHSSLRTLLIKTETGSHIQHVLDNGKAMKLFKIKESIVINRTELDKLLLENGEHSFCLDEELPIVVGFLRNLETPKMLYLSIIFHHSCFDGWSWSVFYKELMVLYSGGSVGDLDELMATYADYSVWQRKHLSGDYLSELIKFWKKYLKNSEPAILPIDYQRPIKFKYLGREIKFNIDYKTTSSLKKLASSNEVSLYSVLLSVFSLMVNAFSGQKSLIIGTPSVNRDKSEFSSVVGFFAKLLAVKVDVSADMKIEEYIQSVGSSVLEAQMHHEIPFEEIIRCLQIGIDPSKNSVVQNIFTLQKISPSGEYKEKERQLGMKYYKPDNGGITTTKFDSTMTLSEMDGKLSGNYTYSFALFSEISAASFVHMFQHLLKEIVRLTSRKCGHKISDINLVNSEDKTKILKNISNYNQEKNSNPVKLAHHIFEHVASKHPNSVAVVFKNRQLTYFELDLLTNKLSNYLLQFIDLKPNDLVSLVLDKSEKMIASILAIWKAGAAYVPIDPNFPDERIAFMLEDTRSALVLTNTSHNARIKKILRKNQPILDIEKISLDSISETRPKTSVSNADLAYAIYTSGTTGKPKAVLVEHRNLFSYINTLKSIHENGNYNDIARVLFMSNYIFDFAIENISLSILSGNQLIIPEASISYQDDKFYQFSAKTKVTYISGTPTQIHQIDLSRIDSLRSILVAGEPFQEQHYNKIVKTFKGNLYNAYGTTETTVYNTISVLNPRAKYCNAIGTPLSNTCIYILGNNLQILPKGAIGELYMAGDCVARGYLNQENLTAERFIVNPYKKFADFPDKIATLYKTGDLVRRRFDGSLQFLGRNDTQVKINGIRIELAEIESAISDYPEIIQCAVIASPGDKHHLVGYFVTRLNISLDKRKIINHLTKILMQSMIPYQLVHVDNTLPMTNHGKLDIKALSQFSRIQENTPYISPRSKFDFALLRLWQDELKNMEIGIDHNFFQVGGDSIKAMMLVSKVQKQLNRKISVKHLFDYPSIREFVDNFPDAVKSNLTKYHKAIPVVHELPRGNCELLAIQQWFFDMQLPQPNHWNQYFAIKTPAINIEQLQDALSKLAKYHDVFRLRFVTSTSKSQVEIRQFYSEEKTNIILHVLNVKGLAEIELNEKLQAWQSNFDIEHGPMWCAAYLDGFEDGSSRVLIIMHHLIVDTVSWQILARDLEIVYNGGDLGINNCTYRNWVNAIVNYNAEGVEKRFWHDIATSLLNQGNGTLNIPRSPRKFHCEKFQLSNKETQALLIECNRAYNTQIIDLLITAAGFALKSLTKKSINYITLESHGRPFIDNAPEIRDNVGWFTAMYPFETASFDDLEKSIITNNQSRLNIPNNGIGYGALRGVYGRKTAPIPNVSFNYLGQLSTQAKSMSSLDSKIWEIDPRYCGFSKDSRNNDANLTAVDITISVVCDGLFVEINSCIGLEKTKYFSEKFKMWLGKIIDHTLKKNEVERFIEQSPMYPKPDFYEPYIIVNENISQPILFVLPPGEGGAESYLDNIAKKLKDVRLVLFNNIHLSSPMDSFHALGQYYINYVKQIQPVGPYHFVGWSFGGLLSTEIALQLTKLGEKIENLIFIDSYFDVYHASSIIGLADMDDILDPINYYYRPNDNDLSILQDNTAHIHLFKAGKFNNIVNNKHQKLLFDYYKKSKFNNLHRLVSDSSITLSTLHDDTHHSWVHNKDQIVKMCTVINKLISKNSLKENNS